MKSFFKTIFAVAITITGICAACLQTEAEEITKNIEDCVFVNAQEELTYAGTEEKVIMLPPQRYTGSEIKPSITIKDGDYTLQEGEDYDIISMSLADNVNVNPNPWMILSVTGVNERITGIWVIGTGNYKGGVDCTFAILSEDQEETEDHFIYSGKDILEGYDGVTIDGYIGTEEEITVPDYIDGKLVQEINRGAFAYHPTVAKVNISNHVIRIMEEAFYHCQKLKEVKLSNQLYGIAECAFCDCISIKDIHLPESLNAIGDNVFTGCSSMEAVHSESKIVYDDNGVLYRTAASGHKDLYFYPEAREGEAYSILDGTTWIYTDAFREAQNLKKIIIPASVNIIFPGKYGSFYGIKNPVNIVYKHTMPSTSSMGILGPDVFYDLPAGSTVTVKNEEMKNAAESAVSENCMGNVSVIIGKTPAESLTCSTAGIRLSKSKKEAFQLEWTQLPADTTEAVSWDSSDEKIATVKKHTGLVSAVDYGKCTVTGTDESGHAVSVEVLVYDASAKHDFLIGDGLKEDAEHKGCHFGEIANGKKEATLTLTDANYNPESWTKAYVLIDGYAGGMPVRIENHAEGIVDLFRTDATYDAAVPRGDGEFNSEHFFTEKHNYIYLDIVGLKPGTAVITAIFDDNGNEIREDITIHVKGKDTNDDAVPEEPKDPDDPGGQTGNEIPPATQKPQPPAVPPSAKKAQKLTYKKSFQKTYGGKAFKLNVKLAEGNGKISYSSSNKKVAAVNARTGKVSIKGTGRCAITVRAAETSAYKEKSVKITLSVSPKKQSASVKPLKGRKLSVKWKKDGRATGYQIQCSTDKRFKKSVKSLWERNSRKTSRTIAKLKKGKTYYVRARSFKSIKTGGKTEKLYGPWSNIKKSGKIK